MIGMKDEKIIDKNNTPIDLEDLELVSGGRYNPGKPTAISSSVLSAFSFQAFLLIIRLISYYHSLIYYKLSLCNKLYIHYIYSQPILGSIYKTLTIFYEKDNISPYFFS